MKALDELNCRCICMERFVISDGGIEELYRKIEESDRIIYIAGGRFGWIADEKELKSCTQIEIEYAKQIGKKICAIKTKAFDDLEKRVKEKSESLTREEKWQYDFVSKTFETLSPIKKSIDLTVFIYHAGQLKELEQEKINAKEKAESEWRKENKRYDFRGTWYSIHTSSKKEPGYLRIGEVTINQKFTSSAYRDLEASAVNYGVFYDGKKIKTDKQGQIIYDESKETRWRSDYEIYEGSKKILGVFVATRNFCDTFGDALVDPNNNQYGVHEFILNEADRSGKLSGTFRNAADPNTKYKEDKNKSSHHKAGELILFKSREQRDNYVLKKIKSGEIKLKSTDKKPLISILMGK